MSSPALQDNEQGAMVDNHSPGELGSAEAVDEGEMGSETCFLTRWSACVTTTRLHFVVSTDVEKPNPNLRKFIRSHCMLGKNRGKTLPPRKRKVDRTRTQDASTSPASPAAYTTTTASRHIQTSPVTVPRKFGSNLSTVRFADQVEQGAVEVVLRCGLDIYPSMQCPRLTI